MADYYNISSQINDPFGLLADNALIGLSDNWASTALTLSIESKNDYLSDIKDKNKSSSVGKMEKMSACSQCGAQMCRSSNDLESMCSECGLLVDGDSVDPDDANHQVSNNGRLQLVGSRQSEYQSDLYKSSTGNTVVIQKKQIYEEYCAYRILFIEAGGRALPLDACKLASDFYNDVQKQCVKRSQNKKAIMAACFYHACLEIGFSPSKSEVALFMQLPNKGIARGSNFVRALVADGKMDVDINVDPCRPEITSLFAHLGLEGDEYLPLREIVFEIVQIAIVNNIGTSSILRSKVAGATFTILRRCKEKELIAKYTNLQEFCNARIRKNTVERFTKQLNDYHSFFKECYIKAGVNHEAFVS